MNERSSQMAAALQHSSLTPTSVCGQHEVVFWHSQPPLPIFFLSAPQHSQPPLIPIEPYAAPIDLVSSVASGAGGYKSWVEFSVIVPDSP